MAQGVDESSDWDVHGNGRGYQVAAGWTRYLGQPSCGKGNFEEYLIKSDSCVGWRRVACLGKSFPIIPTRGINLMFASNYAVNSVKRKGR